MSKEAKWFVPRMWADGEAWILGGGTSLPRQLGVPEATIQAVMNKELSFIEAYDPYMEPLKDRRVIGTNIAFLFGSWVNVLYFPDKAFYRENKKRMHDFKNLKITDTGNLPVQEKHLQINIKRLRRCNQFGLSKEQNVLRWNCNAGAGAINLAYLFGVKRVCLLGFDMKADTTEKTHWHSGERNYHVVTPDSTFKRFMKRFPMIAQDAKKLGMEILNVNPDSAIEDFPKVKLSEVL
jgi:hypothetical protein